MEQVDEVVTQIPPSEILVDDNIRFGLKANRVDELAEQITAAGRIHTPLWVEPLNEAVNGSLYRLTAGNYRYAATLKLNKEGAGLMLPCLIRPVADPLTRLKDQLSENMDRENLSPMDMAVAIKKLMDAGVPRLEIRKMFSRPGGRKGNKKAPASNSYINMMVSFLQFPKAIQTKIHAGPDGGGIGVATAYELTKVNRDKWEVVLERAEADRISTLEREEKDEVKYLEGEKKKEEAEKKASEITEELGATKEKLKSLAVELDQANDRATSLYKQAKASPLNEEDAKLKAKAEADLKAAEEEVKAKEKEAMELKKAAEKLESKAATANKTAQERADSLRALRLDKAKGPAKKTAPGPGDVKKAAAKEGAAQEGMVPLNATDMRTCIKEMALPGSFPLVAKIGEIIGRCFNSVITPDQCYNEIAWAVTKEKKDKPKHVKEAKESK